MRILTRLTPGAWGGRVYGFDLSGSEIALDPGSYVISGVDLNFDTGTLIQCDAGEYVLDGTEVILTPFPEIDVSSFRFIRGWIAKKRRV